MSCFFGSFAGLHHENVSSRLQYLVQLSPKRFHVFEAASIVDESSTTYKHLSRASNPLFHRKDLLAPTTIEATLQAAGKVVHLGDGPTIPLRQGRDTPPRKKIGILSDDSLLLLLVLLCLGDDHRFLHLSSLPQIRPAAHFTIGGNSLPPSSDA